MSQYDGLLQQISDYEKFAIERKSQLLELRQSVLTAHEKLKLTEENIIQMKKELKLKTYQLIDKELTSKLLTSRENIFKQCKAELENTFDKLNNNKLDVSKSLLEDREHFCETIHQLNAKCGYDSVYCKAREQEFNDEISTLEEQKQSLKSDLTKMNAKLDVINTMKTEKENLNKQLENINHTIRKMASSWCAEVQKTDDLENEYQSVSDFSAFNPEFIRICTELSDERKISHLLEDEHNDLQAKFHKLHQKIWQQKKNKFT